MFPRTCDVCMRLKELLVVAEIVDASTVMRPLKSVPLNTVNAFQAPIAYVLHYVPLGRVAGSPEHLTLPVP